VKISISLAVEDVAILDDFARSAGLTSRSAVVQHAVRMLRFPDLEDDYETAWREWESSAEQAAWDATVADGLVDVSR